MKTYFFETYGCEMNIAESASVEQLFISRGWKKAENAQVADVCVINTCSIRKTAEDRILGRLGWFSGLKKIRECKPDAKAKFMDDAVNLVKDGPKPLTIIFMGCMAERLLNSVKKDWPCIDYVVGTFAKHHFGEIIDAIEENRPAFQPDDTEEYKFAKTSYEQGNYEAFVPIMHGCNNFCTYCIVPYLRGREISRNADEILQELDVLNSYGVKDVTLLGQNVNSYGKGLEEEMNFPKLLQKLDSFDGEYRIRFMTSHPKDISDEVIYAMRDCDKVCEYLHLPVQCGSSRLLKKMNRHYTKEDYLRIIEKAKAEIPGIAFSTDLMIGFPGETEEDLLDTIDVVEKVKYDNAFTFIYSKREGTPAAKMEDQIPEDVKHERFNRVLSKVNEILVDLNASYVGKTVEVLIEGTSKTDETKFTGRTRQNKLVNFTVKNPDAKLLGTLMNVKITEANTFSLVGEEA